jgi:hypothetical protein
VTSTTLISKQYVEARESALHCRQTTTLSAQFLLNASLLIHESVRTMLVYYRHPRPYPKCRAPRKQQSSFDTICTYFYFSPIALLTLEAHQSRERLKIASMTFGYCPQQVRISASQVLNAYPPILCGLMHAIYHS